MELTGQPFTFKQRLKTQAPKIVIALLIFGLIGLGGKLAGAIIENQKLQERFKTAGEEIDRLKDQLKQAATDSETALLKVQDACKIQVMEDEGRIGAFAKQAEKCIPIMKRFGVKY